MSKQVFIDKANNIKLIATDIDGVWTDARMHYTENGEYMKSFSTYDGMATGLVKEHNIEIAILTSENSKIELVTVDGSTFAISNTLGLLERNGNSISIIIN